MSDEKKIPPWKKKAPAAKATKQKLDADLVEAARERAEKAGRRYPNLVDNMWAAQQMRARQKKTR